MTFKKSYHCLALSVIQHQIMTLSTEYTRQIMLTVGIALTSGNTCTFNKWEFLKI